MIRIARIRAFWFVCVVALAILAGHVIIIAFFKNRSVTGRLVLV